MTDAQITALATLLMGGVLGVVGTVVFVACYVITVLGYAKMFKKAGEPAWKAFIPFYNQYVLFKRCWNTKMFFIGMALEIVCAILNQFTTDNLILNVVSLVIAIACIVINAKSCGHVSKAYGKGKGIAVGLFFFPVIFSWVLGMGDAQYIAPAED